MGEGALRDVVVLELGTGVAAPYCGRLLSDLGAQVVKVEPPGGDPARGEAPLVDGESAFFAWLNAGKLGLELAATAPEVAALARHADIVLHSERGAEADALEARLMAANPRAVVLSLTPYGRSGGRAGWQASGLTEWATGGFHYFGGDPAREPIALPGHQAEFLSGLLAGTAALAGLWHARSTGEGQRIEMSHQEAVLSCHSWLTTSWTHMGQVQSRVGSLFAKCADGFIFLFNLVPYQELFLLIERLDLYEDLSILEPPNWWARFPEVLAAFGAWTATRTKQEIYHAAQELRIAVSPVNNMADVASNPQVLAREALGAVTVAGKAFVAPGFPYHLQGTPCQVQGPAPRLGEHAAAVLAPGFAWANAGVAAPAAGARLHDPAAGPLAGVRLIEVTANWAGPIAGRHFADLGADVIKIELQTKPATRSLAWAGGDMTWPNHYNRSAYYNKLNRNKRSICLDLSKPAGKEVFLDLVRGADAVLENNSARVMGQLGLAFDDLRKVNPKLVMCSMSGYGATGPERNYVAYGSNIETASGLASLLGYGAGQYFGTGTFYADPVTGNHGSVAMLAALHHARATGEGQWIDMALQEAVLPLLAQPFLEYTVTGVVPEPLGNRSAVYSPQGAYQCLGVDCWVALTVRGERDWQALCGVIGRPELAADPGLASADGRRARQAEVDAAIGAWTALKSRIQAAEALQAAGVPAAPIMPNWEIISDNHLNDRGFFITVRHDEMGTFPYPGWPWRFERTPARLRCPAPMFAEHNHDVFGGLLGMEQDEVAKLYELGVTGDAPIYETAAGL